ncbi:isopeptide-forming domain-containing fimbrial protein [Streptococcus suis]|nr:isopeptide-forming domain-containing fimbrial protein [Streptococcus suis]NQO03800.1 isopeptide-forming domain-containing fimbrial protein [Streptococcus suis]NQO29934.1 isopeptide-forming domain-containing fimbrial protein [Streptococcus suis]NQO68741.1 isopeptide-forming domain-containing fimbrial protein [Streptococcus suis]NQO76683.1 isopeptide-forming domain-containing fimbrial protein [Streptococcus suis]
MDIGKNSSKLKKFASWIASLGLLAILGFNIAGGLFVNAVELGTIGSNTTSQQEGCSIKIETTEKVSWTLPRQPIDLVILQDTSGSFQDTISYVQSALKELTTPVALEGYNENNPRLVFTGDANTTDRVMINTFQGIDGTYAYDSPSGYYDDYGQWVTTSYPTDSNFTVHSSTNWQSDANLTYKYTPSALMTSKSDIDSVINAFKTNGGTPTVPAIEDTIAEYNRIKGDMANNRKTVFLLVTDGVANGVRKDGKVILERSKHRDYILQRYFQQRGVEGSYQYIPEAAQNYLARAQELIEAGNKLESLVISNDGNTKNDGAVVVGFWEDVNIFKKGSSYGTAYLEGYTNTGVNTGDTRTVQEVFHKALQSIATNDSYYINEQSDPQAFSDKILKSVAQALVKEDVSGEFTVTEGYTVSSVTINGKKIVDSVTDPNKEIRGTIEQTGQKVIISVPESVFNPGDNKFDYELKRVEDAPNISEEEEVEPADDYVPGKKNVEVGQLTGKFKVGTYETATIGSKAPTSVEVTDLKYCYPNVSKDVKDTDASNDLGTVDDPIIAKKKSYAANLTTDNETFTYKILYRMNNAPLEFDKNAMLVDRLDYRIAYKNAYVTDVDGNRIDKFTIKTKDVVDVATGQTQTVVYATIPEDPGVNTETIKEGQYGNHKFKRYYLVVEAQLKDEYSFDNNPDEYKKILQENDGLGLMNQATILWNGSEDPVDPNAKTRRSNTVYVLPPVKTDIKKDVQSVEGTTGDYVKGQEQLYLSARTQEYFYNVESVWPGLADSYILSDTLVPELEFVTAYGKGGAKITVNGNDVAALTNKLVVTGNTVKLELTKADFTGRTIARQIATANKGNNGPAVIKLTIKAKIKDGADLSKYAVGGQIKVPNKAQVELNGKPQESNEVYVTPDEPAPSKKINSTLDVLNTTKSDEAFEFNIQTKLPRDIQKYQSYKISDKLDNRLELTNQPAPYIKGDAAQYFDVTYDEARHTVVATAKTASLASMTGGETVELVIPAKIKDGTAIEKIPNTATIFYQTPSSGGEKETPPTPPVHVTPPPTIDKKVNNETHYNLTEATEAFTYTIETQVPDGATSFVISDKLVDVLEFDGEKGGATVQINGTDVTTATTITAENKTLEVALSADQLKNNVGQKVLVTFKAKVIEGSDLSNYIKEGVAKVPNTASYIINTDPKTKKETKPVTVTPPGEASEPQKTVNDQQSAQLSNLEEVFTYKVTAQVPTNTAGFTKFELSDDLEDILTVTETSATVGDATLDQKVTVTSPEEANTANGNVTASLSSNDIAKFAGKTVTLTIKARLKEGVTAEELAKYVTADNVAGSIPNRATLTVGDKPNQTKESENVPVTPPSETPSITKKINGNLEHLDTETATDYSYNIKVKVPADITSYKKFVIRDELNADLAIQGTPVISEPATQYFDVKVEGQLVTATMKNFAAAQELAGKEVELVIVSQIRKGVTTQNIPNTAEVVYQNRNHVEGTPDGKNDTPPVTVTPPGEDPTVEKKINRDLTEAVVLPESNYTYNITSTLPVDITSYKAYAIVDELDENLSIQGTPVVTGDAAKFFDVTVTGNTVKATMKDFKQAKDLAGKQVELVITAQVKSTSTATKIDNTAKVTYQNKNHVDGDPDSETPPTPPVTVTTPPVTKKINENLDHLDTATQTNYTYNIKTVLPTDIATYKRFVITDSLESELAVQGIPTMTGDAAKFFDVKVDGQVVTATITDFEAAKAMAGKEVELVIVSQIREGVTRQAIPNQTTISYTNKAKADGTPGDVTTTPPTPPVTVTPPGETPTVEKKINRDLTEAVVLPESNYTYNITSTLPVDITSYKAYAIVDELDENLSIQGTPVVTGDAAKFFDVTVTGNTVKATMKDFKQAKDLAGKQVELVITAQVKSTSTATKIDNTAKVTYQNKNHVDGDPDSETPPTPPVTVTTPPVTKKINENLDHLDTATQTNYTYNIKTVLPTDIATYKRFVITDSLESELAVQGIPTMTGDAAKFFDVKVDGQVVTATITDFEAAKAMAGKEVELVIVSQIREGVTRQAIPNQTTISYTNKAKADGTPGDVTTTPPTPPVTVTPPGETPTVEKKINRDLEHLDIETEKDYNYNITTNLPVDIVSYKRYVLTDTLDQDLAIQGTPVITGEAAKFFDVTVEGQTVTATMKDFKQAKDLAGKQVELVITAQVREGITRPNIPNTAKVGFTNKSDQTGEKETKPVTVTPPTPNTPPIEKKVNGAASAELASRQEVFTYTIDTVVPTGAFAFEVNDTLEDVLAFEGEVTATLAGKALSTNQITVAGQTVTVKLTKEQVRQQAGAPLQVVFFAKVKDGADLTPYMTDGRTSVPNTASYIINNDPSTKKDSNTVPVYPPTPNEPSVDKKINRDLTHLDVEVNKSYMYNVTADLPQDIATYKEFVVTDIVEPVLAINGEVVAYVDGYATDAVKVTVEGNRVVASVVDFSRLAGFKQIQLYIPAYIKSDADLTAYMKDNAASIPNTASLDFTDSNGVKKRKETTPVTVTPPTPDTPPTPPVNPPQPGTPVKTVSRVAGLEQTDYLALLLATENFRFDIKSVVPMDEADDKRLNLTSLTITDQMDNLFTVSPDKVAVKVTNAPTANANYIDEDVEKAQAALDVEVAKLEEIKQSAQTDTSAAALTEAQNLLATLEAEWTAAEAKLAELTTAELTEAPVETPAVDYASEIAAQEALMAELQAKLDEAKTQVQTAQAALSTAKTAAEVKVEVENQEKVVAEKQTVLDEAKKRQAMVQERIAQLANVNEKGELTAQAIVALGGSIKVEGQLVTVDFTDEYTMEALKGYTVNVIIYSSISDVDALTKDHFTIGIDNTATVQFNHDPSEQLTKKTNKVTVVPPKNDTPPPPPTTPEKPKGELPTPPTPPTTPPAESTPPTPGKTLPKTGVAENGMYALVGMILGTLTLVFRRRKQ